VFGRSGCELVPDLKGGSAEYMGKGGRSILGENSDVGFGCDTDYAIIMYSASAFLLLGHLRQEILPE